MSWCGANCFILLVLYLICCLQSATGSSNIGLGSDATFSISSEQFSFRFDDEPTMCENSNWLQHAQLMPSILTAPNGKANSSTKPKVQPQSQQAGGLGVPSSSGNSGGVGRGSEYDDVDLLTKEMGAASIGGKQPDAEFTCKGFGGEEVNWFVAFKEKGSFRYVFATSTNPTFQPGNDITNSGPVYYTLDQTSQAEKPVYYFAYTSYNSTPTQGHQNGVLMFGTQKGFWLIHSWRRLFKYFRTKTFLHVGSTYGQSFICTTHNTADLDDIKNQLRISNPKPEEGFEWNFPILDKDLTEYTLYGAEKVRLAVHYSRSMSLEKDIYSLIAEKVGIKIGGKYQDYDLLVQVYQKPNVPNSQKVTQISTHKYGYQSQNNRCYLTEMDENADHSKWCVPLRNDGDRGRYPDELNFVCIADLNIDQRRGGAMCLFNHIISKQFREIARKATPIPRR